MTTYRRFVETNEHEETWTFWLQVDGNVSGLDVLGNHLDGLYEDFGEWDGCPFVLEDDCLQGYEVDLLVRYGDSGYMDQHNKIDGLLRLPAGFAATDSEAATRLLRKGGIRHFFVADSK